MTKTEPIFEISFPLQCGPRPPDARGQAAHSPGRLPRITQVLALALHFEDTLRRRHAKDYADVGRLAGLCRERVSQIMRLTYLAPDIQVELLYLPPTPSGRYPISEVAVRRVANLLSWEEQRQAWVRLKESHRLA